MERLRLALLVCACATSVIGQEYRKFPDNFLFGVATASYQIEGAWNSSDKGENIWDHLTHNTNYVDEGDTGDIACDSYNKYKRDVEMLVELGVDFYRFSLSWSRILPTGFANKVSKDGIDYYNNLINELVAHNITPSITLYHWDLPQPLQDMGGWVNPAIANYFEDFARVAFEAFGDKVKLWLTFNEPMVICHQGYGLKDMAPALNMEGIGDYMCAHTLILAHAKAYHLYDKLFRTSQKGKVSLTINAGWHEPVTDSIEDLEASDIGLQFELGWYCHPIFTKEGDYPAIMKEKIAKKSEEQGYPHSRLPEFTKEEIEFIRGTYDYFGLNHYTSVMSKMPEPQDRQSLGDDKGIIEYQDESWPGSASSWLKVVPWGFRSLLNWIKDEYGNPELIVFENGFSDRGGLNDEGRINYYHLYLNAMLDAIEDGCNVTGYTAWSLMDNFEWMRGYTEKFGLYLVDFKDPQRTRTPKASASYYKEIIETRSIEKDTKSNIAPNVISIPQ